jgi:hypothetical protein
MSRRRPCVLACSDYGERLQRIEAFSGDGDKEHDHQNQKKTDCAISDSRNLLLQAPL